MNEWFDIEDGVPDEEGDYLIYKLIPPNVVPVIDERMGWIEICYFVNGIFLDNIIDETANITHWMRMPDPPLETCPIRQKNIA